MLVVKEEEEEEEPGAEAMGERRREEDPDLGMLQSQEQEPQLLLPSQSHHDPAK